MTSATPSRPPEIRYGTSWYRYGLCAAPYQPSRMHTKPKTMSDMPIVSIHLRTLRPPRPGGPGRPRRPGAARRVGTGVDALQLGQPAGSGDGQARDPARADARVARAAAGDPRQRARVV